MRNRIKLLGATLVVAMFAGAANAATGIAMLPQGGSYSENVPQPKEIFGFEVGAQHVRHDQLTQYFRALAASSDRVHLESIGRTHEGREQLLAIISTPENLANLESIRNQHHAVLRGEASPESAPVILWQGYSVHGDESSGSNAVPLYAWHLAASEDPEVLAMLENVVVLIDPSLNPDGMGRFAAWATSRSSKTGVVDPMHQEHFQHWPGGRGNHYWFDLNRDWMLLQHPESRNRINVWNRWRPHVQTDHHEMGADTTFFFQPGVPDRTHPLTPQLNQDLTGRIGEFHAKHLDAAGRFYYTKESFDDFYYGKGSTYPDITGGIGILFEQATTRGQVIDTPYGVREFAESVQNQLITSISTLEAAYSMRDDLRSYQANFYKEARDSARGSFVISDAGNPARMNEFLAVLAGHGIRFRPLTERLQRDGQVFEPGNAWVVPIQQQQSRLIEAMFETRTEFESKVFYDVSTWTMPHAFDLPYARLRNVPKAGEWQDAPPTLSARFSPDLNAVAYAFEWQHDGAPVLLQSLLSDDIKVMAATKPLTVATSDGRAALERGAMIIPLGIQNDRRGDIVRALAMAANEQGVYVHAVRSGLALEGIDLGSRNLQPLKPVKPLMVTGVDVNSLEAGEVWHALDTRLKLPLTHVDRNRFGSVNIDDYTHIILVGGRYGGWGEEVAARLHRWLERGGVLITQEQAANWATHFRLDLDAMNRSEALKTAKGDFRGTQVTREFRERDEAEAPQRATYADFEDDFAEMLVSGAIFRASVDRTHPLAFGLPHDTMPVFKSRAATLPVSRNAYSTVLRFTADPLVSGYVSEKRLEEIAESGTFLADRVGNGLLIRSSINPQFRAYWHGTQRLLVNSLYLSPAVRTTQLER